MPTTTCTWSHPAPLELLQAAFHSISLIVSALLWAAWPAGKRGEHNRAYSLLFAVIGIIQPFLTVFHLQPLTQLISQISSLPFDVPQESWCAAFAKQSTEYLNHLNFFPTAIALPEGPFCYILEKTVIIQLSMTGSPIWCVLILANVFRSYRNPAWKGAD